MADIIDGQVQSAKSEGTDLKQSMSELKVEPVGDITFDGSSVRASVMSNGCTTSEHFEIESTVKDSACQITLMRNKPDFCRRVPYAIEVAVLWEPGADCNVDALVFTNPIVDLKQAQKNPALTRQLQKP